MSGHDFSRAESTPKLTWALAPAKRPHSTRPVSGCPVPHPFAFFSEWVGRSTPVRASRERLLHAVVRRAPSIRLLSGGMGGKQYARASLPRASAPRSGAPCPIHSRFSANGWEAVRPCEPPASCCSMQWCAVPCPFASFLAEWVGRSTPVRASRELLLHAMVTLEIDDRKPLCLSRRLY